MSPPPLPFEKYAQMGAYHWRQCDRDSPAYNPPVEARYQIVRKRLRRVKRILDIGCGDGYLLSLARDYGSTVCGIDTELAALQLAKTQLKPLDDCGLAQASCYDLPFAAESFDMILLTDVFEHLADPDLCLKELCRVLTSRGTLLLTTPRWRADRMWDSLHFKEYTPEELQDCLGRYFTHTHLAYFWPLAWSRKYSTRLGFQAIRIFSGYFFNPFLREGHRPERFGQMLAVCERAG